MNKILPILSLLLLSSVTAAPPVQDHTDRRFEYIVTFTSDSPVTYQWYRGTATNLLKIKLEGETERQIILKPPFVAGLYTCVATNADGSSQSKPFQMSVTGKASAPDVALTLKN